MHGHNPLDSISVRLWQRIARARHRLLMLDFDGALAPVALAQRKVPPIPIVRPLLDRIAASPHTSLAIVSRRPLLEVEALVGDLPAVCVRERDWEQRSAAGDIIRRLFEPPVEPTREAVERDAREAGRGEHLEQGGTGVALHPRGRQKGAVVESLLSDSPAGTLGVFVGDDATDEDAFDAVRARGFGVRVGGRRAPSIAEGRIQSCDAIPEFLEEWLRITERGGRKLSA